MIRIERPRLTSMKRLDLWRWRYFDPVGFKWMVTNSVMSEADAKQQFPDGAEKVEGSLEARWLSENETDASAVSRS
jgi:hypothetical protein